MSLEEKLLPVKEKLQTAVILELTTIPPYLTALFSIKPGTNGIAASIIRSVAMEEMLHMLLAANTLTAIGGNVRLNKDTIPSFPCTLHFKGQQFKNRQFDVHLAAFSKESLSTFLKIELPENWEKAKVLEKIEIPGFTIGEFYRGIKKDLQELCQEWGETQVFSGKKENQISEDFFWRAGGKPIVVTNLSEANQAIDLIVEQGEGVSGNDIKKEGFFSDNADVPHYFRFNEIYMERYYKEGDDPRQPPGGEPITVTYNDVFPIKPDCKNADFINHPQLQYLNNLFNANYSMMLAQLEEGFNGNPHVFYTAIMNGMRNLTPIAQSMVQIKIEGDPESRHAAPSFDWNMDN
jgi:hypothetical protein